MIAGALIVTIALGFLALQGARAARSALDGKAALVRAEHLLGQRRIPEARSQLVRAEASFRRSQGDTRTMVRYVPLLRAVPLVGSQVKGVEAFSDAGVQLSEAGIRLTDAAAAIVEPTDDSLRISAALGQLRQVRGLLQEGIKSIDAAVEEVDSLDGEHLILPLGRARTDLSRRLPEIRSRAVDADEALASFITFAGGDGPRRYLVLSQNPDEVRPTGGFIGTYGVLAATDGHLQLETYDSIESWVFVRPQSVADPTERGSPLRFDTRIEQTLANVNTSPDWPEGAALAMKLWERGGEAPVQGVVSFTPSLLASILKVLGPVRVESYGETVTAANVIERLDFYTHEAPVARGSGRKDFVAAVALEVMNKLFEAPASTWYPLGQAVGRALDEREGMAWSTDGEVGRVLAKRGWDGSVPATDGDFVYPAEFEYSAKNGRQLRRTYDHHVELRQDGSARVTTKVTVKNPGEEHPTRNPAGGLAYITMYGASGAQLDRASDPLGIPELQVAGHPAVGWFRPLAPQSDMVVTVVWEVPNLLRQLQDDQLEYSLLWMSLPDHTGDVLNLRVDLPAGWKWKHGAPPAQHSLDHDLRGAWVISNHR